MCSDRMIIPIVFLEMFEIQHHASILSNIFFLVSLDVINLDRGLFAFLMSLSLSLVDFCIYKTCAINISKK